MLQLASVDSLYVPEQPWASWLLEDTGSWLQAVLVIKFCSFWCAVRLWTQAPASDAGALRSLPECNLARVARAKPRLPWSWSADQPNCQQTLDKQVRFGRIAVQFLFYGPWEASKFWGWIYQTNWLRRPLRGLDLQSQLLRAKHKVGNEKAWRIAAKFCFASLNASGHIQSQRHVYKRCQASCQYADGIESVSHCRSMQEHGCSQSSIIFTENPPVRHLPTLPEVATCTPPRNQDTHAHVHHFHCFALFDL